MTVINDLKAQWTSESHSTFTNEIIELWSASGPILTGICVTLVYLSLTEPASVARVALTLVGVKLIHTH